MQILKRIADHSLPVNIALSLQRFGQRIIRNHMQYHFDDATRNGEYWILSKLAPSCLRFVDVGGNLGDFSAAFLSKSPAASGLIFDPGESAADRLTARFADRPSVRVIRKAISDFSGRTRFFEEANTGLASSLAKGWAHPDAKCTEVDVTTLDTELATWGGADYVKIDAEGHDLAALRGAAALLSAGSIRFIQFEYHTAWVFAGATLRAALDLLASFGYRTFLLKGEGLYEPNYEAHGEYFSYSNYFAVRSDDAKLISVYVKGRI